MITLKNLSKRYGSFTAVNNISLEVPPGGIFAFLGVNGAGKTTTIKMITGILRPTSGSIFIGGFDLVREPLEAKSIVGYIPDRPNIYPKLTGREFLYFVCDLYRVGGKRAEKRIDEVLEEYNLTTWQEELVENYSHGMKQRLATCAALVHEPRILIVDEPMVGLDPRHARVVKQVLRERAKQGMTVFLSTHQLAVAEEIADRIAIINRGKIIALGTVDELRAQAHEQGGLEKVFLSLVDAEEAAREKAAERESGPRQDA